MRIKREKKTGLNIIGKLKVGKKHPEKGYPMSLDYFRFTSTTKKYEQMATEQFPKSSDLKVTFASNDDNFNTVQRLELRDSGGRLAAYTDLVQLFTSQTDGFLAVEDARIQKAGGIEKAMEAMENKYSTAKYKAKFVEVCYLRVMLLDFPVMGVWEIYTKGKNSSIKSILNAYDFVKENAGRVMGVPFRLTVTKVKSNRAIGKDKNGREIVRQYPVIALHPDLTIEAQEQVLALGDQLKGLVTPAKIEKVKAIEAPKTNKKVEEAEYADYEEMN
jgi:hypothetical protein